ncbi:uncharacterized protein LOC134798550 [Cydia splendana]|uniref:uncharacterized protein LOC134798550 n=1 Tax=Cydia splendana TaxID=1100963 RepID=UPI00300C2AA3
MSTSWIYHLKKPELIQQAEDRNIPTTDLTVEQIRKLLVKSIKATDEFQTPEKERPATMSEDEGKVDANRLTKLIREWNLSFKGYGKPEEFLERLEELIAASGIEKEEILPALPRILQGKALAWYRNNTESCKDFDSFLKLFKLYYYPSNYEEDLIVRIVARKQRFGESFVDYLTDLQTLMRRSGNLSDKEQLHRIHENMTKNYKLYVKKTDFKDLSELVQLTAEYESILTPAYRGVLPGKGSTERARWNNPPQDQSDRILQTQQRSGQTRDRQYGQRNSEPGPSAREGIKIHPRYDPKTCCWSCGKFGHDAAQCRSQQRIFCSTCGILGTLSKNCCKKNKGNSSSQPIGAAGDEDQGDTRPFINVTFNGVTYECLIDTGSTHTYVNEEVYKVCKMKGNLEQRVQRAIVLANGTKTTVRTAVLAKITMNNGTLWHWVRVMPMASTIIIGMDILRKMGMKITWSDSQDGRDSHTDDAQAMTLEGTPTSPPGGLPPHITDKQKQQLEKLLESEFEQCDNSPKGNTWVQHKIKMKHNEPIKQKYYPRNPSQQQIIDQQVKDMLEQGIIEKSDSPYSSPVVLVKKENGQYRFCIDFRKINEASEKDAYPIPQIDDTLEKLRNAQYFSKFDLKNGYWNVSLEESSRPLTAFTVPGRGLFHFKVMPFGLHSSGATFQRLLDQVISPELEPHAYVYLDDIIVCSTTFEDHLAHLKEIFHRIRQAGLQINKNKCEFAKPEIEYLGHTVTREGIKMNEAKIRAIVSLQPPKTVKAVRTLIGMTSWYRKFIPNYATITAPLVKLLKKGEKYLWNTEQQEALEKIKTILTTDPILARADFSKRFTIQTDASDVDLGAILTQEHEGLTKVVMYASRSLTPPETRYSTTEKECLAVIWGIRKMRAFIEGYHFTIITDHQALKWLNTLKNPSGRLARWALELQQYQFDIIYRSGKQNQVADQLSRNPVYAINTQGWYDRKLDLVQKQPNAVQDYRIKGGQLYKKITHSAYNKHTDPETEWKLCVPEADRGQIMHQNHDMPSAGHLGMAKTTKKIMQRYYWPVEHPLIAAGRARELRYGQEPREESTGDQPQQEWNFEETLALLVSTDEYSAFLAEGLMSPMDTSGGEDGPDPDTSPSSTTSPNSNDGRKKKHRAGRKRNGGRKCGLIRMPHTRQKPKPQHRDS